MSKDTIYIDAEDEITAVIDKVRGSSAKIVALVLPKRANTFQSIVNLKLLKRTTTASKKSLVLITSDPNLVSLAGTVGLHVAKSLQTKPEIPAVPTVTPVAEVVEETAGTSDAIGQLAGEVATEDTIDLDNEAAEKVVKADKKSKKGFNKKLKIPDFDRFRLLLFGGIALVILLIVGGIFGFVILPKAKIVIKTDTTSINTDLKITATTDVSSIDQDKLLMPAISKQSTTNDKEQVPATGQRDDGTKATGTMTVTNCTTQGALELPAGTTFTAGDKKFVSNEAVTVPTSNFVPDHGNLVCQGTGFRNVAVTAESPGGAYNLSARSYSVDGQGSGVTAKGTQMNGGTSKLTQVVSQSDVDKATQKVLERMKNKAADQLKDQFAVVNAVALTDTFSAGNPTVTTTPNVGDAASQVTVNVTVIYTELGLKGDDIKQVVENDAKQHIDSKTQVIQDNGIGKAVIQMIDKSKPNQATFQFKTIVVAGPQLDSDGIKKEIAGKKKGQTQSIILSRAGTKDVTVTYSPFWVYSTPKNPSHITITFEQNDDSK